MPARTWPYGSLFEDLMRLHDPTRASAAFPAINLYDDGESFLVRAELPGIDKETLDVSAKDRQLTLRGERQVRLADERAGYHRRERESGRFRRIVTLPERIEADKVVATYTRGVLEIRLPRAADALPRRIEINS